jgi:hypothetical protein
MTVVETGILIDASMRFLEYLFSRAKAESTHGTGLCAGGDEADLKAIRAEVALGDLR